MHAFPYSIKLNAEFPSTSNEYKHSGYFFPLSALFSKAIFIMTNGPTVINLLNSPSTLNI